MPGTISSGLGSFGYDVRLGYKFKVFSPIHAKEIDPKNFDPKCLVDVDLSPGHFFEQHGHGITYYCQKCGDSRAPDKIDPQVWVEKCPKVPGHLLIPPHSFVLAESLERFKIPRDVLCVVVGKSTYARCFSGDTRVVLASGKSPTFRAMADKPNVRRWGFGVDSETGTYMMTELIAPRCVGRENLVRVTFDNGMYVDCTPDHEFLRHGGYYTQAQDLMPGHGVVPLYENRFRDRRSIWIPQLGNWLPAHWLADQWNLRHGVYSDVPKTHRHHKDEDKTNDNPTNIERKSITSHVRDHNKVYYGEGFDPDLHSLLIRAALQERMKDPEWVEAVREMNSAKGKKLWTDPEFVEQRVKITEALRKSWNAARVKAHANRMRAYNETVTYQDRQRRWTPERKAKQAEVMRRVNEKRGRGNHSVVSVTPLKGLHEVFCLTSKDTGNFALDQGVVVKNCGLIVNVTPGEPEWEGVWTIEISNTTPLPVRVYPGEGIMQAMFFRSDEKSSVIAKDYLWHATECDQEDADACREALQKASCERSYADKAGKYMGQTGLTLPKAEDGEKPTTAGE